LTKTKSFRAKVDMDKKVLSFYDKDAFLEFIQTIPGEIDITVSEVSSRSHWQNRYYWAMINDFLKDNSFGGYTKEEVHRTLKIMMGVRSTTKLSKEEFIEYLDKVQRWADEQGIHYQHTDDD
tara:strand:- start:50 stop:415 length:366 start_codon:yes stop_codon:yes gene_type:complete